MEWTRAALKTSAKDFLRTRYWYAFLVSLIAGILAGGSSGYSSFSGSGSGFDFDSKDRFFENLSPTALAAFVVLIIGGSLFAIAYSIFVGAPITIGANRWYIRGREGEAPSRIGLMFSIFRRGAYLPAVGGYAWMQLWVFLWSLPYILVVGIGAFLAIAVGTDALPFNLPIDFTTSKIVMTGFFALFFGLAILFIVPVIIKTYAYRMTPWILADNPRIGYRRALKLSMAMTREQKIEIFVLDLSFIGWQILGFLLCCVGLLFVMPYVHATHAELYDVLKRHAVERGDCTMEELGYARTSIQEGMTA